MRYDAQFLGGFAAVPRIESVDSFGVFFSGSHRSSIILQDPRSRIVNVMLGGVADAVWGLIVVRQLGAVKVTSFIIEQKLLLLLG